MSNLIICPDCGKEISASAKQCPNCGCPNKESDIFTQDINSDSIKRNPGCIAIAVVVFMFLFVSFMEGFEEGKNKKTGKEKETIYSVGQTVSLGSWNYKVNKYEWAILALTIGLVISCELINTSIEATVDLVTEEYHPLAKVAKDTSAAAVFIFAIVAIIVGIIIFLPKIIALF